MSEKPQHDEALPGASVDKTIGRLTGAVCGAAAANTFWPATVHPVPGLSYTAQLSLQKGIGVNVSSLGVQLPHALDGIERLPFGGVHIESQQLNVILNGPNNTFKTVAEVVHQLPSVAEQTGIHIAEHLAIGGGVSAILGGYAAVTVGKGLSERGLLDRLRDIRPFTKTKAALMAALVLSGCGAEVINNSGAADSTPRAPLEAKLTDSSPLLKGAYETGVGKQSFQSLEGDYLYVDNSYKSSPTKSSNTLSTIEASNFMKAWNKAGQSYLGKLINNPDDEQVVQVSDVHCYYPGYSFMKTVLDEIGPTVVVDDGDIQTNEGKAPYESKCVTDEEQVFEAAAAANRIVMHVVRVNGNHDAKQPVSLNSKNVTINTLRGNNNSITVDGLTFVGDDDPRDTVFSTEPEGRKATDRALAMQGSKIATAACAITEQTGQAPYVLSHAVQGSFEALLKGCASIAFNGHTHINSDVDTYYGQDGLKEYQHTVGTSTGVSAGITVYQQHLLDSTMTDFFINKRTHEPDAIVTIDEHNEAEPGHPKGSVEIENQPFVPSMPSDYEDYLVSHYSPTAKQKINFNFNQR